MSTVELNEECSTILQNKLFTKLKDLVSFTILCFIGSLSVEKALANLGAREPKPTRISIQLPDRSIKYPKGIIEDVLVEVDKFIFPFDFVIFDMDEDVEVPLILS
ncbi:gag-asp_proteas domain-containing protein [Gossypium australe]|uniref:Gag-asp_proteas domain-containing protein n=1 Tax=Gossypium australe TaxID=47621 RepID=A0A5B6VKL2_9ROSI|nr:gag-asp_proteas domain-containing protein [Gossypium australe]